MKPDPRKAKARPSARVTFRLAAFLSSPNPNVWVWDEQGRVVLLDLDAFLKSMSGQKKLTMNSARRALNNYGCTVGVDKFTKKYYISHEKGLTPATLASLIEKPDPRFEKVQGEPVDTFIILGARPVQAEEAKKDVSRALSSLLSKISTVKVVQS
jgi:hypothetical protein